MAQPPSETCRETLSLCVWERRACLSLSLACPAAVLYSPLTSLKNQTSSEVWHKRVKKGVPVNFIYLTRGINIAEPKCSVYLFSPFPFFWHWYIVSAPKTECCPSLAVCLYFTPQTHKSSTTKRMMGYKSYKSSKSVRNLELKLVPSRAAHTNRCALETGIDTQPWSDFQMWIYNTWSDWLPGYWLNQCRSHTCGFFTNSSCFSHKVKREKNSWGIFQGLRERIC